MRFYVLWDYIYINDQSYEFNKIINKDLLWFFHKVSPSKKSRKLMTMFVVPLLQDTTSYRKNSNVDKEALHIY